MLKKLFLFISSCFIAANIFAATELDYMEYATDGAAQTAYVSSGGTVASPILHYKMNDNAATSVIVDAMADTNGVYNDRVAGAINTSTGSVAGKINTAINIDDDYVYVAKVLASATYSVSMWIKSTDTADAKYLYDARLDGGTGYGFLSAAEAIVVSSGTVYINNVATSTGIVSGVWSHVVVTGLTMETKTALIIAQRYALAEVTEFVGPIDDFRVYSGTLSAADIAAIWNDGHGTEDENPRKDLQCYSESTIKTQGSNSLKGVALITDSLNDTLTKSGLSIDLSGLGSWKFDIYASRTGANIKLGIHDSGGTTTETTYTVLSANTWETVTVDISGVSNANKDAIDSIIATIANADAANTFYLDNMFAETVAARRIIFIQ